MTSFLNCEAADKSPSPIAVMQAALLRSIVDEIDCGVLVCNVDGIVAFANQASLQVTRQCGDGHDVALALQCRARDAATLHAAIRHCAAKSMRQLLLLQVEPGRLMVSIVPLRTAGAGSQVLLLLGRRGSCSPLGLEMLGSVHGLTMAERRVLAGLLTEASPREVADALHIALSTVRTHISSMRLKLGARSIEALLMRVAEVPPMAAVVRSSVRAHWTGGAASHLND